MSNIPKPTRVLPKTLKASTVDRMDAIAKGLKRKHVKLSRSSGKHYCRTRRTHCPDDREIYLAKRYARSLSHFE